MNSDAFQRAAEIFLSAREPFEGPVTIAVAGDDHALGAPLAARMRVRST